MNTRKLLFAFLTILPLALHAEEADNNIFRPQVNVFAEYGYNYTWRHYADLGLQALMPINKHFELDAIAHFSTANIYTVGADFRPLFPLTVGDLYLETKLSYRAIVRNQIQNLSGAFSIGYRMDYVRVQLGAYSIMFAEFNRDWHGNSEVFIEAPSLLYALEVWVRPQSSIWNINLKVSNYNDYSIERLWQPLFAIGARYDFNQHLKLLTEIECKPTGMFHLDASFYGITGRIGVGYKF